MDDSSRQNARDYPVNMALMQQVQACPWSPFKLHEIATLEKCLSEVTGDDPRIGLILRKLATGCLFVEPARKISYLSRDPKEKYEDIELSRQAGLIVKKISILNTEISYYREKITELTNLARETNCKIIELQKSIILLEDECATSLDTFGLTVERVSFSFDLSLDTITQKIPDFVSAVPESVLTKLVEHLPRMYRQYLIEHAKEGDQLASLYQSENSAKIVNHQMKKSMIPKLNDYIALLVNLFRDLVLIDRVCSTEIPEEIEYLKTYKTHLDFLEKPLEDEPPKRIIVRHEDLNPGEQPAITAGPPQQTMSGRAMASNSDEIGC